jgi:hypothetical protein
MKLKLSATLLFIWFVSMLLLSALALSVTQEDVQQLIQSSGLVSLRTPVSHIVFEGQGDGSLVPLTDQNFRLNPSDDRAKTGPEEPSLCPTAPSGRDSTSQLWDKGTVPLSRSPTRITTRSLQMIM